MSRNAQKHFYLLVLLLNGILSFANSGVSNFTYNEIKHSTTEFISNSDLKQVFVDVNYLNDFVEISESEIEEETYKSNINKNFDFFYAYFGSEICENFTLFTKNKLTPSKYLNYLSFISSRNIIFCVYRI